MRTSGWRDTGWNTYDDKRFQETFKIAKATFLYILDHIRPFLKKETLTEHPISPEYLYRLGRGDYMYNIAEMTGSGVSTVCTIVLEVCEVFVRNMWYSSVGRHVPNTEADFKNGMMDFEQLWQFLP